MLTNILLLILDTVIGFFTFLLLLRFYMQWLRVSFRNQLGQFVVTLTDWLVRPLRRFVPGVMGLDMASLLPAVLLQALQTFLSMSLRGYMPAFGVGELIGVLLLVGLLEVVKLSLYLLIVVVFAAAILSWVSPYSPWAPVLNGLARPFLRPIQRVIPPIANVDLSPLVLLLLLQIVLMLLGHLRGGLLPLGL